MWYFTWILGVLLACCLGIMNVLRLEAQETWEREHETLDPLTRMMRKDSMLRRLREKVDNSKRNGMSFSVIYLSLNEFRIKHGLDIADMEAAILHVADTLNSEIRAGLDIISRFSDDEFVIALPGASLASAEQLARRMKYQVFNRVETGSHLAVEITAAAVEYQGQSFPRLPGDEAAALLALAVQKATAA